MFANRCEAFNFNCFLIKKQINFTAKIHTAGCPFERSGLERGTSFEDENWSSLLPESRGTGIVDTSYLRVLSLPFNLKDLSNSLKLNLKIETQFEPLQFSTLKKILKAKPSKALTAVSTRKMVSSIRSLSVKLWVTSA